MNKVGLFVRDLDDAEIDLRDEFARVAEREAAEQDVYYMCHTLAEQCAARAEKIRQMADHLGADLDEPKEPGNLLGTIRHKASEMLGRQPGSSLLLLRDLRQLYVMAEGVNIHWIIFGQVAQALRDEELLAEVSGLHKQTLTQIKWLKTRIKEASPQALLIS